MMWKKLNFESAYKRLEEIHNYVCSTEVVDIEKLIWLQAESKELYSFCKGVVDNVNIEKNGQ